MRHLRPAFERTHTLADLIQLAKLELSTEGFMERAARAATTSPGVDCERARADTRLLQSAPSTRDFIRSKQEPLHQATLHAGRLSQAPSTPHTQATFR